MLSTRLTAWDNERSTSLDIYGCTCQLGKNRREPCRIVVYFFEATPTMLEPFLGWPTTKWVVMMASITRYPLKPQSPSAEIWPWPRTCKQTTLCFKSMKLIIIFYSCPLIRYSESKNNKRWKRSKLYNRTTIKVTLNYVGTVTRDSPENNFAK